MKRVTGIGGIFFPAKNPAVLQEWYRRHLGIDVQDWGGTAFSWADDNGTPVGGSTIWSIQQADAEPATPGFTINYRVENLSALLVELEKEGVPITDHIDDSEYGQFARLVDPEGNKVELWQPPEGQ